MTNTTYTPIEIKVNNNLYFMIKQYVIGNTFEAKKRIKELRIDNPKHIFRRQEGLITEYI